MKRLLTSSVLLLILIGIPLVPSYLDIYYMTIKSNQTASSNNEANVDLQVLKGDIAYLKAIFSRANNKESNNNGEPAPQRTSNSITQLVFTVPSKIEFFIPQIVNNKALNSFTSNLSSFYLKIPSPPPKLVS